MNQSEWEWAPNELRQTKQQKRKRIFSRKQVTKHLSLKFWDPRDLGMLGVISICFGQSPQIPFGYAFGFYFPCSTRPLWFLYHYLLSFPFHKHSNKWEYRLVKIKITHSRTWNQTRKGQNKRPKLDTDTNAELLAFFFFFFTSSEKKIVKNIVGSEKLKWVVFL